MEQKQINWQQHANDLIEYVKNVSEKVTDTAGEQLPLFIQDLIRWHITEYSILAASNLLIVAVFTFIFVRCSKRLLEKNPLMKDGEYVNNPISPYIRNKRGEITDVNPHIFIPNLIGLMAAIIFIPMNVFPLISNAKEVAKGVFAPRILIVEKVKEIVSGK